MFPGDSEKLIYRGPFLTRHQWYLTRRCWAQGIAESGELGNHIGPFFDGIGGNMAPLMVNLSTGH